MEKARQKTKVAKQTGLEGVKEAAGEEDGPSDEQPPMMEESGSQRLGKIEDMQMKRLKIVVDRNKNKKKVKWSKHANHCGKR